MKQTDTIKFCSWKQNTEINVEKGLYNRTKLEFPYWLRYTVWWQASKGKPTVKIHGLAEENEGNETNILFSNHTLL